MTCDKQFQLENEMEKICLHGKIKKTFIIFLISVQIMIKSK